jgi:predicted nucleic acid-binding protein
MDGESESSWIIIADANILINFIRINALYLLENLPKRQFGIPTAVYEEILPGRGRERIDEAIHKGAIKVYRVESTEALTLFYRYTSTLGTGEASCLALVRDQGWILATDDRQCRSLAAKEIGTSRITGTVDLLKEAIESGLLTIAEADQLLVLLEQENFRVRFKSFRDILKGKGI